MNKERDTKAVKEIIDKVYGDEPTAVLISRIPAKYKVICNEEVAKAIIEAGYGDTKQAVREFAEKLKIDLQEEELNSTQYFGCVRVIDYLVTEVTGE